MNDKKIDTNVIGCLSLVIGFMMLGLILFLIYPGENPPPIDTRLKIYNISGHKIYIYTSNDTLLTNNRIYEKIQSYKDSYYSEYDIENFNYYIKPYSNTEVVAMGDWFEYLNATTDKTIYCYLFDRDSLMKIKSNCNLDSSLYDRIVLKRIDITEKLINEKYWILKYVEKK